jgi:hypothetical protein
MRICTSRPRFLNVISTTRLPEISSRGLDDAAKLGASIAEDDHGEGLFGWPWYSYV